MPSGALSTPTINTSTGVVTAGVGTAGYIDTTATKTLNLTTQAGLRSTLDTSTLDKFTTISNSRDQVYQLIDTMCQDSTVSSIVRTYASEVCQTADNGHIV